MITTVLILTALVGLLDTIAGNYFFPGKEGIVETNNGYFKLYKYNRIMLIPIKMWREFYGGYDLGDFTISYSEAKNFYTYDHAFDSLTKSRKNKSKGLDELTGIKREVYCSTQDKIGGANPKDYSFLLKEIEESTTLQERQVLQSVYNKLNGKL